MPYPLVEKLLSARMAGHRPAMFVFLRSGLFFVNRRDVIIRLFALTALLFLARVSFAAEDGISNYRLGSGDIISITVFEEKELSLEKIKLSDAGSISYPLLGEIKVKGLTVSELQQKVISGLKGTYLINPLVTVSVDQYRDVFVNGQVHKPGNYPYQPGLTVRKAVSIAGGFKDRANKDTVSIIHEHQDKPAAVKGEPGTLVEPGDTITVEESFF
ncbi:MAG TPA: polysaccharide biosynthesis/export family protein [Gallionella sp.]|nr:polysaccharide biosynthesis/export family protein [Gallionella sp.]